MENNQNLRMGVRRFSQNRVPPELFKVSDGLLSNLEDFSNKQLPQQGKDINLLSAYYNKKSGNGNFMERIGKLNKKFYNCTDKYVKSKKMIEKLNDDLYLNLFQQIDCYVEEIERLNKKISLNNNQELKKTIDQLNKEISEKKEKIRNYEVKLKEKTNNEEKLKKEIESYKRSLIFYKDKIKIGILNRNNLNTYGRETNTYYRKKLSKQHTNKYLSPTPEKKMKSLGNRTKTNKELLKLDTEINNNENINEDNEDEEKKKNIIGSGEKDKPVKKIFKPKESVYKFGRESNYFFENRNDFDTYGKDIEEKDDEYEFDSNFDYLRPRDKSKTVKSESAQNEDKLAQDENSQKFSSGLLSSLAHEIYENKNNETDSNKNLSEFNKNISSDTVSEKKESSEIDNNSKSKTLNVDKKESNKNKTIKKISHTGNKNENIKSKIFNQKNNSKTTSKTHNKNENNESNNNKTKQAKTATKSKPKKNDKSSDRISNFNDVHTPYTKNKFKKQFDKEKDKEKNTPTSITQTSSESTPNLQYNNNTLPSNQKRGSGYRKIEVNRVNNKDDFNATENKFVKIKKKTDLYNNKNPGYNSMSNLNAFSKYNSSKNNVNKKMNEKENNKELASVLRDVNDDYLKSIEMLRKQEEQIKYMLRFIDLDEN